jgi:hypothetical protein
MPDAAYELGAVLAITKTYVGAPGACAEDTSIRWEPISPRDYPRQVVRAVGPAVPVGSLRLLADRVE